MKNRFNLKLILLRAMLYYKKNIIKFFYKNYGGS